VVAYRPREPPNHNKNVTHKVQISPPHAAKERLTLPWQKGGRGMTDIIRLYDIQVKLLQTHFFKKQASSPLHVAVVKADDRHTPLDLLHANENDLAKDQEYNNKVKRQWSQKPYTADTRTTSANNM